MTHQTQSASETFNNIVIEDNYSEYWQLDSIEHYNSNTAAAFVFIPFEYKKPSYTLTCTPDKVNYGEASVCSLNVKYYNKLEKIDFELSANEFNISNIKINESFENLSENTEKYSLSPKNELEETEEGIETTLITFEVRGIENKRINIEENIKGVNLKYSDQYDKNNEENEVIFKVEQHTPSDETNIENPKTGNTKTLFMDIISAIVFGAGIFLILYMNKNTDFAE